MHIDRGFKPTFNIDRALHADMRSAGILMPDIKGNTVKSPVGVPVHTPFSGVRAAVWLPDVRIQRDEYPAMAIVKSKGIDDFEMLQREGYYLGLISRDVILQTSEKELPDELFAHANHRLQSSRFDNISQGLIFPEKKFREILGINKLSKFELERGSAAS